MYISSNEIAYAHKITKEIREIESLLDEKEKAIKAINESLEDTASIMLKRPSVSFASQRIDISETHNATIARYLKYESRYGRRHSMSFSEFIEFSKHPTAPYADKLSDYGKRFILPCVDACRTFNIVKSAYIDFKLEKNIPLDSMSEYSNSDGTITHTTILYHDGRYELGSLSLRRDKGPGSSNDKDAYSGISDYYPFWEHVSKEIKQAMPLALLKLDTYIGQATILNETLKEVLFPIYAKKELFNRLEFYESH